MPLQSRESLVFVVNAYEYKGKAFLLFIYIRRIIVHLYFIYIWRTFSLDIPLYSAATAFIVF